ncbi:hypothetical protein QBC41DRAFT_158327 [Cercophora samala]|uniref:RING-type domain-containing protein n=1 Tax=Cercophora samala TaxID=330535 RepID=A0AA39Z7X3_9PEZI|nr:hypothetical protein QBC41DRAFT_158327 [Cercophora samala]
MSEFYGAIESGPDSSSDYDSSDSPPSPPPWLFDDIPDYESVSSESTIRIIDDVSALEEGEIPGLRTLRREDASLEESESREEDHDMGTYIPDPKFTFLFDPNRHNHQHTCAICLTSPLFLLPATDGQRTPYDQTNDSVPCVLPCGHMFGQACIRQWMQDHDRCPVCRTAMVHELCRHKIKIRPMWQDTVWLIPRTVPDGGKIGAYCSRCEEVERRSVVNGLMETLGRMYYNAKLRWERTGRERDRLEMMKFRVRMDGDVRRLVVREEVGEW